MKNRKDYEEILKEIYDEFKSDLNDSDFINDKNELLKLKDKFSSNNRKIDTLNETIKNFKGSEFLSEEDVRNDLNIMNSTLNLYNKENLEINKKIKLIEEKINNDDSTFVKNFEIFLIQSNIIKGENPIKTIDRSLINNKEFLKIKSEKVPEYLNYIDKCVKGLDKCNTKNSLRASLADCIKYFLKNRNIEAVSRLKKIEKEIGLPVNSVQELTKSEDCKKEPVAVTSKNAFPILILIVDNIDDIVGMMMKYKQRMVYLKSKNKKNKRDDFEYICRRFLFEVVEGRIVLSNELTKYTDPVGCEFYLFSKRLEQFKEWMQTTPISSIVEFPSDDAYARYDLFSLT